MKTKTRQNRRRAPHARRTQPTLHQQPYHRPAPAPHDADQPALPGATPHEFLSFAYYPGALEPLTPIEYPTAV